MAGVWQRFDRRFFELKLLEPSLRMHKETEARRRRVASERRKLGQGEGVGFYALLVDSDLEVLREYLEEVDRICREVWQAQGEILTPEFVRAVRDNAVFPTIAARCGSIRGEIELMALRIRFTGLTPVLHHLVQEKGHLEGIVSNRYEIEARDLEWKNTKGIREERERKGSPKVSRLTQALPAPIDLSRHGSYGLGSGPKHMQVPKDLPLYYPNDLTPQTQAILVEAVRKFPDQTGTLKLCTYVISKVTPVLCVAVRMGTMRADQALSDSGMGGIVSALLVYNCDNENERFRLDQEVRKSDEWMNLAQEIADVAQQQSATKPRTSEASGMLERSGGFTHSDDYRSVALGGETHSLTERQAQVIQILHEAYTNGTPEVGSASILEKLETPNSRLLDTFKTNRTAWKALIARGERKGTHRLNL